MKLRCLTPDAFDDIAGRTRLKPRAREMARAVLVHGRAQVEVAAEFKVTKQRVNLSVAVIERAYWKTTTPGASTLRVELDIPEVLALGLTGLSEALMGCEDAAQRNEALKKVVAAVRKASKILIKGNIMNAKNTIFPTSLKPSSRKQRA